MKKRVVIIFISFIIIISSFGSCANNIDNNKESETLKEHSNSSSYSTWAVYWDMNDVQDEINSSNNSIESLSYFEAYFNKEGNLEIPEGFLNDIKSIDANIDKRFITIVNDIVYGDGRKNSLKDTEILKEVFSSHENMRIHIDNIVEIAKRTSVSGVEIDYENIRSDMELWDKFLEFQDMLYNELKDNNLDLRIILETQTPFDLLDFPEGPQYVIMCYNLHGGKNNIGPKADKSFLRKIISDTSNLPGDVVYALATGGFDWSEDGNVVKAIKEIEAEKLIKKYNVGKVVRDDESGALTFRYIDEDQKDHIVWYADGETIDLWKSCLNEDKKRSIAIWRLGGNDVESIKKW